MSNAELLRSAEKARNVNKKMDGEIAMNTRPAGKGRTTCTCMVAIAMVAAISFIAPWQSRAATCSTGKPTPITETWTASKVKSKGAEITIYSGPTDRGAQLQITSGIEKSLWVASTSASAIMKITTKGHATLYTTPTRDASPEAIAQNGRKMFFTEWNAACAGSITASGEIKEYSTGLSQTQSTGMALGPHATDWFVTDYNGIGKISAAGKIKLFSFGDEGNQPLAITAGPAGNMWFLEGVGPNIGYITPSGKITEYNTGLGDSYSFGIATGSDGRIWFAENGNNSIAAITANGKKISDYTAGFSGDPISIVAGPDGNLYFGETTPVVGRITTKGKVTEFPFPATEGTFPILGITVGPDKNIWFANNSHSQVGVLKLPIKE
jgi:virginiamycin B lyase